MRKNASVDARLAARTEGPEQRPRAVVVTRLAALDISRTLRKRRHGLVCTSAKRELIRLEARKKLGESPEKGQLRIELRGSLAAMATAVEEAVNGCGGGMP